MKERREIWIELSTELFNTTMPQTHKYNTPNEKVRRNKIDEKRPSPLQTEICPHRKTQILKGCDLLSYNNNFVYNFLYAVKFIFFIVQKKL